MQVGNSNLVYIYVPRLTMHSSTRFRLTASPRPIQIPKRAHQLHHVRRDPPVLSLVSGAQQVLETVNPDPWNGSAAVHNLAESWVFTVRFSGLQWNCLG